MLRRIVNIDPVEGVECRHLTTGKTQPPGLLVFLDRQRRDIEPEPQAEMDGLTSSGSRRQKVFDGMRNRLGVTTSLASRGMAKTTHALFRSREAPREPAIARPAHAYAAAGKRF